MVEPQRYVFEFVDKGTSGGSPTTPAGPPGAGQPGAGDGTAKSGKTLQQTQQPVSPNVVDSPAGASASKPPLIAPPRPGQAEVAGVGVPAQAFRNVPQPGAATGAGAGKQAGQVASALGLGIFAKAATAAGAAAAAVALVKTIGAGIDRTAAEIAPFSPAIAAVQAQQDVARTLQDIRAAGQFGGTFARLERQRGEAQLAARDARQTASAAAAEFIANTGVAGDLRNFFNETNALLKGLLGNTEGFAGFVGENLPLFRQMRGLTQAIEKLNEWLGLGGRNDINQTLDAAIRAALLPGAVGLQNKLLPEGFRMDDPGIATERLLENRPEGTEQF